MSTAMFTTMHSLENENCQWLGDLALEIIPLCVVRSFRLLFSTWSINACFELL